MHMYNSSTYMSMGMLSQAKIWKDYLSKLKTQFMHWKNLVPVSNCCSTSICPIRSFISQKISIINHWWNVNLFVVYRPSLIKHSWRSTLPVHASYWLIIIIEKKFATKFIKHYITINVKHRYQIINISHKQ